MGADLIRNPIILGILGGAALRFADAGVHPVADKTLALVAQAGVPTSLIALGAGLRKFRIEGQGPLLGTMCLLTLLVLPLAAGWLALEVLHLPKVAAGVVIIVAAMPAGANAFLFASRYGRVIDSTSGAIARHVDIGAHGIGGDRRAVVGVAAPVSIGAWPTSAAAGPRRDRSTGTLGPFVTAFDDQSCFSMDSADETSNLPASST